MIFRPFLAVIATAIIFCGSVHAQPAEQLKRASELLKQANESYSNNRYDDAVAKYSEYIKIRPTIAAGWYNRGLAYRQKGEAAMNRADFERAVADFSQAIKIDPKDADFWLYRGHVRARLIAVDFANELPRAIADYSQAIKLKPTLSGAYSGRGRVYEESNQHAKALPDLNRALQLDPNDYVAYYTRGKIYGYSKNYAAARSDLEKAIRLYPNYEAAKSFLKYVGDEAAKSAGSPAKVPQQSAQIVDLAEGFRLAEEAEKAGNNAQVIEFAARSLRLIQLKSENVPQNELNTSIYMSLLRKRARALSALGRNTESDDEYRNHGMASLRNINRYIASANETLGRDKNGSPAGWIVAKIEAFKGVQVCRAGIDGANEWMEAIKRTRPNDNLAGLRAAILYAGIRDNCSAAYMVYGDYQAVSDGDRAAITKNLHDALTSYAQAVQFAPGNPRVYQGRAKVYRKLGRVDLALADEKRASELPIPK